MSLDISSEFTQEGIQKLSRGQLLRFELEGLITELVITYINKKTNKVRAKQTKTYTQEELEALGKKQ